MSTRAHQGLLRLTARQRLRMDELLETQRGPGWPFAMSEKPHELR